MDRPFAVSCLPGSVYANRIPTAFYEFGDDEVRALANRGCTILRSGFRTAHSPLRPRLIQAPVSVEPVKPGLTHDTRPLDRHCHHVLFTVDTVGTVAQVGWQGRFQGSLDDRSGFHHVLQ